MGADGSVRLFDLRFSFLVFCSVNIPLSNLEHSTIIYESPKYSPLLRVKWSHINPNLLATLIMDTESVIILDIRFVYIIPSTSHSLFQTTLTSTCDTEESQQTSTCC